jgi:hypothetical protein
VAMSSKARWESKPKVCSVEGCGRLAEYYCQGCRRYFCKVHASHS